MPQLNLKYARLRQQRSGETRAIAMPQHIVSNMDPKRPKRSHGLKMKASMSPYDNPLTSVIDGKPEETVDWISKKVKCRPDFSSLSPNALRHVCACFVKVETKKKTPKAAFTSETITVQFS